MKQEMTKVMLPAGLVSSCEKMAKTRHETTSEFVTGAIREVVLEHTKGQSFSDFLKGKAGTTPNRMIGVPGKTWDQLEKIRSWNKLANIQAALEWALEGELSQDVYEIYKDTTQCEAARKKSDAKVAAYRKQAEKEGKSYLRSLLERVNKAEKELKAKMTTARGSA